MIMKSKILVLLLLFTWNFGLAQNNLIDSLKYKLANAKTDTGRVLRMISLVNSLAGINPDSALYYGEKALALARKIKFPKGEIRALSFTSGVLTNTGNLPKALSMAFEALQIAEKNKLDKEIKWPFVFISSIYKALKDFPKAINFTKKALQIAEASSDTNSMSIESRTLGGLYIETGQLDSASFFLNRALVLNNKGNVRPSIFNGLGDIEAKKGDPIHAMEYYQKVLNIIDTNNHRALSQVYMSIANLYKKENKRDSGIYYAERAVAEAQPIYFKQNIIEASTLLSELYEPVNSKESYRYYKLAITTKESLFGAGNIQSLQMMIAQEEERQKEVERAKAAFQNQLKQYALFMALAVFLLIAFIFYRNNKKQKEANTLLRQQKDEIQITLTQLKSTQSQLIQSEKMASLGELTAGIAHEIQNPLNFVNNFSELNTELIKELKDETIKGNLEEVSSIATDIESNSEKINHHGKRAADIVKGMLQHSSRGSGKKEPTDINKLADEYLRLAYHGLRAKDKSFNATMITEYDESIGNINIIPQDIGRVILNLITNAFYAVNEKLKQNIAGYEPTVTISTSCIQPPLGGRSIEIKVSDNGGGIPQKILDKIFQPFFTTKPTGQGTGLGLSLSYDIVKAHGGELKVETKEGEGAEFIIQLPLK